MTLRSGYYGHSIHTLPTRGPIGPYASFTLQSGSRRVVVMVYDAYELRDQLKGRGYKWQPRDGHGRQRTIPRKAAAAELAWQQSIGVHEGGADAELGLGDRDMAR
jgi:hypothetical protein